MSLPRTVRTLTVIIIKIPNCSPVPSWFRARKAGERVKVVGTCNSPAGMRGILEKGAALYKESHSPCSQPDIAVTEGYMVSLEKYRRVLSVNRATGIMKVEAGITLQELNEEAAKNGLAMSNLGSIVRQAIAGALSTGTHGTGINFGILATFVRELEVINAMGEVLRCSGVRSWSLLVTQLHRLNFECNVDRKR